VSHPPTQLRLALVERRSPVTARLNLNADRHRRIIHELQGHRSRIIAQIRDDRRDRLYR